LPNNTYITTEKGQEHLNKLTGIPGEYNED